MRLSSGSALVAWLLTAVLGIAWVPVSFAQESPREVPPLPTRSTHADDEQELPVSLDRIRKRLAASARTAETRDGLRLRYYVDVYGVAPPIEIFPPDFNLTTAPAPYGGMTHREFLDLVTPQEFKSPPADIPGAIAALVKWLSERRKDGSEQR